MIQRTTHNQAQVGFSLVEMAIVLVIVALLMAGLLPTLSSQVEQQHRNETRRQVAEIQQALIGYAVINGRLPCPADGTITTGQPNAGAEARTGSSCTNINGGGAAWGVVPWATLGVTETDSWGRRFTYHVTATFADTTDGTGTGACTVTAGISFQLCSAGNLSVLSAVGGTNIASNIPAVVVSHGTDGLGAYTPTGQQIQPVPAVATDQGANIDANSTNFVSHDVTPDFDDLVVWISPNILLNRMVAAGKLP